MKVPASSISSTEEVSTSRSALSEALGRFKSLLISILLSIIFWMSVGILFKKLQAVKNSLMSVDYENNSK